MSNKYMAQKAVAPYLSKLFKEAQKWLKATSGYDNYVILINGKDEETQTRIFPMDDKEMEEMFKISDKQIKYNVHTDEAHNVIGEDIK